MSKLSAGLAFAALAVFSASAEAQDRIIPYADYSKAAVQDLTISISNQVGDECLPRPSALEETVERSFQAAGIPRSEQSSNVVWVSVLGYAMDSSSCAVSLAVRIDALAPVYSPDLPETVSPLAYLTLSSRSTILTWPKDGIQDQIEANVAQMSDAIALEIVRARSVMAQ